MVKNYLSVAFRSIFKHRVFSIINILGLAVSMSVCLLVITVIVDQYSVDQHNPLKNHIYRINTHSTYLDRNISFASAPLVLGKELKMGVSAIQDVATIYSGFGGNADTGDKVLPIQGYIASSSYLRMMNLPLLHGNIDNALEKPYSIVLKEKTALKLFNSRDVVGKLLSIGKSGDFTITGVLENTDNKYHIDEYDMLVSINTLSSLETLQPDVFNNVSTDWKNYHKSYVYVQLNEEVSTSEVEPLINKIAGEKYSQEENLSVNFSMQPLTRISPSSEELYNEISRGIPVIAIYGLATLALMIMVSACFNYTNLSIARALTRAKEIGIRKVSGATQTQLFVQFITESIIVSLFALFVAIEILHLLKPALLNLDPQISQMISLSNGVNTYLLFVVFSIFVGVIAGLFPAIFMTKINVVHILKDLKNLKLFTKLNLRKALIVVQFTISLLFIISATIMQSQFKYALQYDLGFNRDNVINVDLQENDYEIVKSNLEQYPEVADVAGSQYTLGIGRRWIEYMRNPDKPDSSLVTYSSVSKNYLSALNHKLVSGRTFPEEASDSIEQFIIINEYMATSFGYGHPQEAIGKTVSVHDVGDLEIIGVVKDFNYNTLERPIHEFAFRYNPNDYTVAHLQISSDNLQATLLMLENAWTKLDPAHKLSYEFYDEQISETYKGFIIMNRVMGFFAFLAITISCLGILGMAVYSTESRLKEIGIRKVLGANLSGMIYLLSKGFIQLILLSVILAIPISVFGYNALLSELAFHAPVTLIDLFLGAFILLTLGLITISFQILGAVRSNPTIILKSD